MSIGLGYSNGVSGGHATTTDAMSISLGSVAALHTNAALRGVPANTSMSRVGIDQLPAGASLSGTDVIITGTVAFTNWTFFNTNIIVNGGTASFTNCLFAFDSTHPAPSALMDIYVGGTVLTMRWCSFIAPGYFGGAAENTRLIRCRTAGSGLATTGGRLDLVERSEFFGYGSDAIVTANSGSIRFNYFDTATNLPTETAPWSASTSYQTGDVVTDTGTPYSFAYVSLVDDNLDNALPSEKADNASWANVDPHVDIINPQAQVDALAPLIIEGNFFNRSDASRTIDPGAPRCVGMNNAIRTRVNQGGGGADDAHYEVITRNNVVTQGGPRNVSMPFALRPNDGSLPYRTSDTITDNWVTPRDGGEIIDAAEMLGNTVQDNDLTYASPTTGGAGYMGPAISADPTILTIAEPQLPVYDANAHGGGVTDFTINGTHDADGAALQYRIIRVSDGSDVVGWTSFTAASGGVWSAIVAVAPSFDALRAEVRAAITTSLVATQTGEWRAGFIVGYMGQSLARRPLMDTATAPFTPPAKTLWLLRNDVDGVWLANGLEEITAASLLGPKRMAAVVAEHADGPVLLVDMTQNGTGRYEAADDTETGRSWARTIADPVGYITSRGSTLSILFEAWFTGDAATQDEFERNLSPFYIKRQIGGLADTPDASGVQDYTTSTAINVVPGRPYQADHHLWDLGTAGTAGLFDAERTKWVPFFGAAHINRSSVVVDGQVVTNDLQKATLRSDLEAVAASSTALEGITLSSVSGWSGQDAFGGHIGQPADTHIAPDDPAGEVLVATSYMTAIMRGLGQMQASEPRITGAMWASDGTYVDVTFSMPHGGTLSTPHIQNANGAYAGTFEGTTWTSATADPATLRELHEVHGFNIIQGTRKFGDFTAVIHDAAAGIVRITPDTAFVDGDAISFGYGDGVHILSEADMTAARPYQRMPIETRTHVDGAGFGYPVVKESAEAALFTASGITAAADPFTTKSASNTGYFTGPNIPSGVSGWTLRFDGAVGVGGGGSYVLAAHSGLRLRVMVDTRSGRFGTRFNLKGAGNVQVFNGVGDIDAGDFPQARGVYVVSFTLDDGTGIARVKSWLDGVEQQSFNAPSPAVTTFDTDRSLEVLNELGSDVQLYALDTYHAWTSDGDVSDLTPVHSVSGSAAAWNAPGTGLVKAGDAFT